MSSREPLWFCHECQAEMRPLMVPDPVCASCHGSFVEQMENPADDPREFATDAGIFGDRFHEHGDEGPTGMPNQGVDALLLSLQTLMDRGMGARADNHQRQTAGPNITFEVRGPSSSRTLRFGGPNRLEERRSYRSSRSDGPDTGDDGPMLFPRINPFGIPLGGSDGPDRPNISGPLMAQYLMALLGNHEPGMFGMPENGRMGDYVYNQEALDQIISQIMENSNAHRPVPATDEIIAKLPREVLMKGSKTLEQDCAVCKDQFKLETEDPDEQIVVTLPCRHPFHEPCIKPWLTSSGTCPVCRYALVPQPDQHPAAPNRPPGPDSGGRGTSRSPPPPSPNPGSSQGSGNSAGRGSESSGASRPSRIHNLFSGLTAFAHPHHNNTDSNTNARNNTSIPPSFRQSGTRSPRPTSPHSPQQSQSQPRRSNSDPHFRAAPSSPSSTGNRDRRNGHHNVPGSWTDELD